MKPPIRTVCSDCLSSVELDGEAAGVPAHCPVCGGMIDGGTGDEDSPIDDVTRVVRGRPVFEEVTPWTETWSKGTLGTIGRYQLRELLGDGGFGQVYQAYDPRLDRDVALKVLKMANPGERVMQRFFREARAAARLQHPNIVGVYDAGRDGGRCWIAYQFVKGVTLARRRDVEDPDHEAAVRITRDLADALDYAHRGGVYHRDLKPANVMIDEGGRPRLTDFGLSRRADLDSDLTRDGTIIGTPAYMSPEQASGRSNQADERSDVYSLGVILFEMLSGRRPGDLPTEVPASNLRARPGLPAAGPFALARSVPAPLRRICATAVATDPADRYPNARALADDLDRWLDGRRGRRSLARSLAPALTYLAAVLLLFAALWFESPRVPAGRGASPSPGLTSRTEARPPAKPAPRPAAPPRDETTSEGDLPLPVELVRSTGKYHLATCRDVKQMKIKYPIRGRKELAEAKANGIVACLHCNPDESLAPATPPPGREPE